MNMDEFKSRTGLNILGTLFSLLLKECSLLRRSLSYLYIDMVAAAIPAEVAGSRISPDNSFQSPPTQPSFLLMLLENHLQCASTVMVPSTKSFSFDFQSTFLAS